VGPLSHSRLPCPERGERAEAGRLRSVKQGGTAVSLRPSQRGAKVFLCLEGGPPVRQTIAALVENHAGVLVRVAGLCSRRGCNIESLTVGPSERPDLARMTIVIAGGPEQGEQMVRQLGKLVDVLHVEIMAESSLVARELALCKVRCGAERRAEVLQVAEVFRARVVDVAPSTVTLEATGDEDKVSALVTLLAEFGIVEMARTGRVALARGPEALA
jgi:acetolactate synthase-1/3 small subunit